MHQHAPVSGGGHGAEGQLGSSWPADGVGGHGVYLMGQILSLIHISLARLRESTMDAER